METRRKVNQQEKELPLTRRRRQQEARVPSVPSAQSSTTERVPVTKKRKTPPGANSEDEGKASAARGEKKLKTEVAATDQATSSSGSKKGPKAEEDAAGDAPLDIPPATSSRSKKENVSDPHEATAEQPNRPVTTKTRRGGRRETHRSAQTVAAPEAADEKIVQSSAPPPTVNEVTPPKPRGDHEIDLSMPIGHVEHPMFTMDASIRALIRTLEHGKEISFSFENIHICAECRGGGDMLSCDNCQFSFHSECLEPLERLSYLYVPTRKYGLRSNAPVCRGRKRDPEIVLEQQKRKGENARLLTLDETEWYCPYCLAAPIQRYWKRGIPQFLASFKGLPEGVAVSPSDSPPGDHSSLAEAWLYELKRFVANLSPEDVTFPPEVLLAMTGLRRIIQRLGPLYQHMARQEIKANADAAAAAAAAPLPGEDDEEFNAEPKILSDDGAQQKASILQAKFSSSGELGAAVNGEPVGRRRRIRGGKPIVPEVANTVSNNTQDYTTAARMNVGQGYQIPGEPKHFLEALEHGLDYRVLDKGTVYAYLPCDPLGRVPYSTLASPGSTRLVYSRCELGQKEKRNGDGVSIDSVELTEYIKQAIQLWPAWIPWPPTQEYALKLLHHCRYEPKAALRLLCSDSLQFRAICDPPIKPYMNKWRPRDKRGHLPSIPFPPPSPRLQMIGLQPYPSESGHVEGAP